MTRCAGFAGEVLTTSALAFFSIFVGLIAFSALTGFPDFTIFFGADTLLIPELREVATRFPQIDLALLAVNGLQIRPAFNRQVVMNAQEAAELAGILRPRVAVPMHYTYTAGALRDRLLLKYTGTAAQFAQEMEQHVPATAVHILAPGEPLEIPSLA